MSPENLQEMVRWLKITKHQPTLGFNVPGKPVPWTRTGQRPTGAKGTRRYTTKALRDFEDVVSILAGNAQLHKCGECVVSPQKPLDGALLLLILFEFHNITSQYGWKPTRPDTSNLTKAIEDGIQKSGAVKDDACFALTLRNSAA